ncbi:condensation domain-containing protein [Streptomyces sp. Midd1]|uniref:condensation domain-containing protein n=1 Tax=Streptomyces sp. Midd3 TaxID=3161191 RepID=UPI0034DB24DE
MSKNGVGLLITTVPVRVRVGREDGESPAAFLTRLQDEQSALAPHHHLGLPRIQELAGHGTLFDTSTVFENYPVDSGEIRAGRIRVSGLEGRDAYHYPMSLMGVPGERLYLQLSYRPDLFDRGTAERTMARLREVLATFTGRPDPGQEGPVEAVQTLFAEILDVERVGPDDDFFALGGNSLRALRLAARLRALARSPRLAVRAVFDRPTPRALARHLR